MTPERLRDGALRRLRRLNRRQRLLTSRWRLLPSVIVIGAQKAGTTSLYRYLAAHPDVGEPLTKEPGYFGLAHGRGLAWYRSLFPPAVDRLRRPGLVTLEASTDYIDHPHVPARIDALLPEVRLVALLRDPVERAYSHYHHTRRRGREPLSFEEAILREEERVGALRERIAREPDFYDYAFDDWCYVSRGRYAEQLPPWLERFGDRLLVLRAEDLFEEPARVVDEVLDFVGLRRPDRPLVEVGRVFNASDAGEPMRADTRARLVEHYAPHNARLYALLGRDLGWPRP